METQVAISTAGHSAGTGDSWASLSPRIPVSVARTCQCPEAGLRGSGACQRDEGTGVTLFDGKEA